MMADGYVTGQTLTMFLVDKKKTLRCFIIKHNKKGGWCKNYLRSASKKLAKSLVYRIEK